MACKYYYREHEFNSELELDNFLLNKEQFFNKYGDIVFNADTRHLQEVSKLDTLKIENDHLWEEYRRLKRERRINRDEDGEESIDDSSFNYEGVNSFLSKQMQSDGVKKLFPDVRIDEFFNNRIPKWRNKEFSDSELQFLFDGDESNIPDIITPDLIRDWERKMRHKFNWQARMGDAVHEVLQVFFTDDNRTKDAVELKAIVEEALNTSGNIAYIGDNIEKVIGFVQSLHQRFINDYGDNCKFYPEFIIKGNAIDSNGNDKKLFGKIDLLIVDGNGRYHIIDYKTSTKQYSDYDLTKKEAYHYQLLTYYQMLENAGMAINDAEIAVIPIQLQDFKADGANFTFNGVASVGPQNLGNSRMYAKALDEVLTFMPSKYFFQISTDGVHQQTSESIANWFGDIPVNRAISEEGTMDFLNRKKVFNKKNDRGKFEYTIKTSTGKLRVIETNTEAEMVSEVMQEWTKRGSHRHRLMETTLLALQEGQHLNSPDVEFPQPFSTSPGASTWIKDTLSRYCNREWEVLRVPGLEELEIITLRNKETNQLDFVSVSTNTLHQKLNINNRKSLLAKFLTDAQAEQQFKRLALVGDMGNLELMQVMLAINYSKGFENATVGNISVINPYDAEMSQASNEELLMNFNTLARYSPIPQNNFDNGTINLASHYDLLENYLAEIWCEGEDTSWQSLELRQYATHVQPAKDMIDAARQGSTDDKIKAVSKLIIDMRQNLTYGGSLQENYDTQQQLNQRKIRLYNLALYTLAELRGINFRQQNEDHAKWFTSLAQTFTQGQSGNYTDNPGNLDSETLNLITSLIKEAYQNTRDDTQKEKSELDKIIIKLKNDINFTRLKEVAGFNQADIYKQLYREVPTAEDGINDLLFKKVDEVSAPYRPLLKYALETINARRFPNASPENLQRMIDDYDPEYYRVPYVRGRLDSEISARMDENSSVRGLTGLLADKLKMLNPKNWNHFVDEFQKDFEGVLKKEEQAKKARSATLIYEMENQFEKGDADRMTVLKNVGLEKFERNLETLLLKHSFVYSQTKHINTIFPLIQAAAAHISIQGANSNQVFAQDKSYLEDYIRSKVKHETIITPELQGIAKALSKLKQAASAMTLAFAPVQMLYQPLQGLWTDISLAIRKPDGKDAFTFEHFKNSIKLVYGDLFNFSGKPTLCSKINEVYALNDMDINKYIDAITGNRKGFYNFTGLMFKFASRPDYYNRMSIFLSQMQADGCLEAHEMVGDKLVYNWKKDKRFSKFAENPHNTNSTDPEYIKQRSLYYAIATQFEREGVLDENGEPFVCDMENPKPLPRAYTVRQAEGYKSLADDIYGYYSEENKSLVQATALGSMWLQFKTYWSGKKNQYLQSGGIRMRGSWEQYSEIATDENGQPIRDENGNIKMIEYYYGLKDDGSIDYNKILKAEDIPLEKRIAPVMQWKGQWQEGILVTLSKLIHDRHLIRNYHQLMQEDPDMARCYKSNMIQLAYDMLLFIFGGVLLGEALGDWLKRLLDDNKDNEDFVVGLQLAAANVAVWSIKNSFLDFNIFDSIGGPLTTWTPFAVSFTSRQLSNLSKIATGDQDIVDGLVNMWGGARQVKPIFNAIKPEMFRTKQEGGTWESNTSIKNRERRENQ